MALHRLGAAVIAVFISFASFREGLPQPPEPAIMRIALLLPLLTGSECVNREGGGE